MCIVLCIASHTTILSLLHCDVSPFYFTFNFAQLYLNNLHVFACLDVCWVSDCGSDSETFSMRCFSLEVTFIPENLVMVCAEIHCKTKPSGETNCIVSTDQGVLQQNHTHQFNWLTTNKGCTDLQLALTHSPVRFIAPCWYIALFSNCTVVALNIVELSTSCTTVVCGGQCPGWAWAPPDG